MAKLMTLMVLPERCTGCRTCENVCSYYHEGSFNPARSRIQVVRDVIRGVNVPLVCQQCEDAPCVAACPTGALSRDAERGLVEIDYSRCIGCKTCVSVCPFGGMSTDPVTNRPIKCDFCGGDPQCVKHCVPGALLYVPVTAANVLQKRRVLERIPQFVEVALPKLPEVG